MRHTPGPWTIGSAYGPLKVEIASAGYTRAVATVWVKEQTTRKNRTDTEPWPEGEANAALIAAAPDLLEALEMVMRLSGDYVSEHPIIAAKARAAIAKANNNRRE